MGTDQHVWDHVASSQVCSINALEIGLLLSVLPLAHGVPQWSLGEGEVFPIPPPCFGRNQYV